MKFKRWCLTVRTRPGGPAAASLSIYLNLCHIYLILSDCNPYDSAIMIRVDRLSDT